MNFGEACINYPSIMLLIEPETGNILEANKKAADTYGYSIEELKTMTILDINVLKKEQVVEEMRIAREESRNYFHFPHRTKNGFIIEMEVESYPTKIENKNILLSFIRPCEKRSYFNSAAMKLVQESRDIVVVLDQNCRIIRVNKKFE
ncbi:MAG TPA: PAS domain S-box protein, partial [Anaerovoracaceae bacterium]|nr:PAS domain S-box protein [Anaerovoracaceae bacterium]